MTLNKLNESVDKNGFNLDEKAVYLTGTISDDLENASGVVIEATKGAVVDVNVDSEVMIVSEEKFTEWKSSAYSYLNSEQKSYLEEHHRASGKASWLLAVLGAVSAGGNYDHYRNTTDTFNVEGGSNAEGFMKSLYNLESIKHKVTGTVKITGKSHRPSKASIFIHMLNITFLDGKSITVIDNKAVAADPDSKETNKLEVVEGNMTVSQK